MGSTRGEKKKKRKTHLCKYKAYIIVSSINKSGKSIWKARLSWGFQNTDKVGSHYTAFEQKVLHDWDDNMETQAPYVISSEEQLLLCNKIHFNCKLLVFYSFSVTSVLDSADLCLLCLKLLKQLTALTSSEKQFNNPRVHGSSEKSKALVWQERIQNP